MIRLSEKSRRVLRAIYRGLGVTAVSFVFQACYGMPLDEGDEVLIYGSVQSQKDNTPIPGIKVSVADSDYYDFTDSNGDFSLFLLMQDRYTVTFEDVDGPQNGGLFKPHTENIPRIKFGTNSAKLNVDLEEDTEE
jgi:hypothetical protein